MQNVQNLEQPVQTVQSAERVFGLSIVFSGIRCIIMYVIFPFVLPVLGIVGSFATQVDLVINVLAISGVIYSTRKFWRINYKHKVAYTFIAVVAVLLMMAFMLYDVALLQSA